MRLIFKKSGLRSVKTASAVCPNFLEYDESCFLLIKVRNSFVLKNSNRLTVHKCILTTLILVASCRLQAGERLGSDQFEIYADTVGLSFDELSNLESENVIRFSDFDGLDNQVQVYWLKIDSSIIGEYEYLFLSNFFERIEAYYKGDTSCFSLTGKFVNLEDRTYKKGFYRSVVRLKEAGGSVYIKLVSTSGQSKTNRTLSHIELSTVSELENQSHLIFTSFTLLMGMSLLILIINLLLTYLQPSATGFAYSLVVLTGILMTNSHNQIFIDWFGATALTVHYLEVGVSVVIVYAYGAFAGYYLRSSRYSKYAHHLLVFPYFPVLIVMGLMPDDTYFPMIATLHFLIVQAAIIYLLVKSWKNDKRKVKVFVVANGLPVCAAMVMLLALKGVLPHHFLTTNAIYIGFILRDIIFTVDLIRQYFGLMEDSIKREAAINKLTEEKEQLERIEKLKTAFFNNISHELRTPLTLIISPLENSLKSGKVPTELEKELSLSLKNGKYLQQLVVEMLDLAKLDKGELDIVRQPTDVVLVIKNVIESFQPYAKEKEQTLFITHATESIIVMVDQDKFEKIIINLISNAVKYSAKEGSIYVKVIEKGSELEIQVTDESRGISENELPRIFDRYFQSEDVDQDEGTGIGLSIVKEFMNMHHGSVSCKSKIDEGSTFTLSFPRAIRKSNGFEIIPKKEIELDNSKFTLLVIEDHSDMRSYIKDNLSDYNIIEAANGVEGLQKLKEGLLPDLILTDYMMPKLNGYELAQEIKANDAWADISMIFLTARTLSGDKVKVLNLGVDDYIVKPFDLEELKVRIKNLLEVAQERKEAAKDVIPNQDVTKRKSFKKDLDNYTIENLKNTQLSNTDLAYHFSLSERNLYRQVKLATGRPPASYIREIRLQKARLLLETETEMTVSEIAYDCGIDNLAHFSQSFKKRFGKLPSAYSAESG